jgi:non-specific serine/threonine protein kinase/serine/threonine-protein kinase
MTSQPWEQVKDLLHQAMQLAPEQRARFLDEACSGDALRAEVESLLLAGQGAGSSFLRSPAPDESDNDSDRACETWAAEHVLQAGQIFSERFQLVRKLGEGGMGQVWLAEQTSPVRRQVALKLIKAGMYDEPVVRRFQSERQSLALMDHPAIAKVFDAGATPQGQPYFVMEYVPGLPITEYCDQKKLKIGDRLELFIQACEGVQHAHQKAIVHRDLKPANILVVEVDGKPMPRIIDFGLAKVATAQVAASLFTQLGHFVGTPGFMSPEQADPGSQDIDTRSDVYSLGVVLYVLLAGSLPFDTKPGQRPSLDELLRKLREEEPPRPSIKAGANPDALAAIAAARGSDPHQLLSLLRGDLDWIAMKALEKDRTRRYGAPSELAADIRRYLNHETVTARPASRGYRLRKYARRHRVAVTVAAGLVLLLAAFSILQAIQLRRITRERDRANRITDFMTGLFKTSDPSEARGNSVTAREILDKASKDLGPGLGKDPEVQSQLMYVMARTYGNLGLYSRAHKLAEAALDARTSLLGRDDPRTLESMTLMGWILDKEGSEAGAEKMERQALAGERRVLGPEDPLTLRTEDDLAIILLHGGHYAEEEKLEREAIGIETRVLGPDNAQTLQSMNHLGVSLLLQSRFAEAEPEYRRLLDVERRVLGPDHPETLKALANLSTSLQGQDRFADAEPLYREALATQQRVLGPEHQNTLRAMFNLAGLLALEGRLADSDNLLRKTLAIQSRTLGPEYSDTLGSQSNLADLLFREGHVHDAEKLQRETLDARRRVLGPGNPLTLRTQSFLAEILIREGRYAEAEKLARQAFEVQVRSPGLRSPQTLYTLLQMGMAMALSHRYAEAAKLFQEAIEKGGDSGRQANRWLAWYNFACVAEAANHSDDALRYLREAVNRGYKNADGLTADENLKGLRQNPRFQALVAELKRPPARVQAQ